MKTLSLIFVATLVLFSACSKSEHADDHEHTADMQHAEQAKNNLALHQHDENIALSADSLYACPMDAEYVTSDPDTRCTNCEMEVKPIEEVKADFDAAEAEMYRCSMHPEYVTSDPNDQCPICEMKVAKGE